MKRAAVLASAATLVGGTAVACSKSAERDARVAGAVRLCGGPAPGRCFGQDARVSVLDGRGRRLASQRTRHARFAFALAQGRYTLLATGGGLHWKKAVVAAAHKTTHANIVIPIP